MFSDAISSISWRCRPSSPLMAAAISGSASASVAVKNEPGAEAVLMLEEEEVIARISPPPQPVRRGCGRSRVAVGSYRAEIPYRPPLAKRLRYKPDIYARYGGDGGEQGNPRTRRSGEPDRHSGMRRRAQTRNLEIPGSM